MTEITSPKKHALGLRSKKSAPMFEKKKTPISPTNSASAPIPGVLRTEAVGSLPLGSLTPTTSSAGEIILTELFDQLSHLIKRKVDLLEPVIISGYEDNKFFTDIDIVNDTEFSRKLTTLEQLAKHSCSALIKHLFQWRKQLQVITTRPNFTSKTTVERFQLLSDYLFHLLLLFILKPSSSTNSIDDEEFTQVEKHLFDVIKNVDKRPSEATLRGKLHDVIARIIGLLSEYRFSQISNKILGEVNPLLSSTKIKTNSSKLSCVISCARFVQLEMTTKQGLENSVKFITKLLELLKGVKKEAKKSMVETFSNILHSCARFEPKPDVNYSEWYKLMNDSFESIKSGRKKITAPKPQTMYYPLLLDFLSLCDKPAFLKHCWSFLDMLFKGKALSKNLRKTLESYVVFVQAYLNKFGDPNDINEHLQQITAPIFPTSSKKGASAHYQAECLDVFVDILVALAKKELDYTLSKIVFETLLVFTASEYSAEKIAIGLRTIISLQKDSTMQIKLKQYSNNISAHLSQILLFLDNQIALGNLLTWNHSRGFNESIIQNKRMNLLALKIAFKCIPAFIPARIASADLINFLARCTTHIDKGVSKEALSCLHRLMVEQPIFRAHIIHGYAEFIHTIPDGRSEVVIGVVHILGDLITFWGEILEKNIKEEGVEINSIRDAKDQPVSDLEGPQLNALKVEGLILVFLCSHSSKIRSSALKVLRGIRTVANASPYGDAPIRFMDVFDETGDEIIQRLNGDFMFRILHNKGPIQNSLSSLLAADETSFNQICWTYCLSELMKMAGELCAQAVSLAWSLACTRIGFVIPEDSSSSRSLAHEQEWNVSNIYLWRNYIVFGCTAVPPLTAPVDTYVESIKSRIDAKGPDTPRELFQSILPFLQSKTNLMREAARMALERVNQAACSLLFGLIRVTEDKGKTRKLRRYNTEIGAIYGHISDHLKQRALIEEPVLLNTLTSYISDMIQFFNRPENEYICNSLTLLRFNLCIIIKNVALQLLSSKEELFEMGLRRKAFMFLMKWSKGEIIFQEEPTKTKLAADLAQIKNPSERSTYELLIRESIMHLQYLSCNAMSALLHGPSFETEIKPNGMVLSWIELQQTKQKKLRLLGRASLENFLLGNVNKPELVKIVLDKCYSADHRVSKGYFLALVQVYRDLQDVQCCTLPVCFNLILFKVEDKSLFVRRSAIQFLQLISSKNEMHNWLSAYFPIYTDSRLVDTYIKSQLILSEKLAADYSYLCYEMFNEMVTRLEQVDTRAKRSLLTYIVPWVRKFNLDKVGDASLLEKILQNALLVTLRYFNERPTQFTAFWMTLAAENENIPIVIDFTLSIGVRKHNADFIPIAKRITGLLASVSAEVTVDTLVNELSTLKRNSVKRKKKSVAPGGSISDERQLEMSLLSAELPDQEDFVSPARGHYALILLAELAYSITSEFKAHLPVVLQQVFLGLDFESNPLVHEHSRILLLNLIQCLVVNKRNTESPEYFEAMDIVEYLTLKQDQMVWNREDRSTEVPEISSNDELASLVSRVTQVLTDIDGLNENWGSEALSWALSCPSIHLQCRSFQIYRVLRPTTRGETLIDVLQVLLKAVKRSDATTHSVDNFPLIIEALLTLQVIVENMEMNKLILFNQIFWSTVSFLQTDYEEEYLQSVRLLSKLLDRINVCDTNVQNVLLASAPKEWDPPFKGVQPLILRGIYSSYTEADSIIVLAKITLLPCDPLFHTCTDSPRLLANLLGLLPWICYSMVNGSGEQIEQIAQVAANLASAFSGPISYVFQQFASFITPDDLLAQLTPHICQYFPAYLDYTYGVLFELLERGPPKYARSTLIIIRYLLEQNTPELPGKLAKWLSLIGEYIESPYYSEAVRILSVVFARPQSCKWTAESPLTAREYRLQFCNLPKEGCRLVASQLDQILMHTQTTKSENIISPDFFSKYFSTDDMVENTDASPTEGEVATPNNTRPSRKAPKPKLEKMQQFGPIGLPENDFEFAKFPTFTGFEDIMNQMRLDTVNDSMDVETNHPETSDGDIVNNVVPMHQPVGPINCYVFRRYPEVLNLWPKWQDAHSAKVFSNDYEIFTIFPYPSMFVSVFCNDYHSSLQEFQTVLQQEEKRVLQSSVIRGEKIAHQPFLVESKIEELQSKFSTKFKNIDSRQDFLDQRASVIEQIHQLLCGYFDLRDGVDRPFVRLKEFLQTRPEETQEKIAERKEIEVAVVKAIINLNRHLLKLLLSSSLLDSLANRVLCVLDQQQLQKKQDVLEEEIAINRTLAETYSRGGSTRISRNRSNSSANPSVSESGSSESSDSSDEEQ